MRWNITEVNKRRKREMCRSSFVQVEKSPEACFLCCTQTQGRNTRLRFYCLGRKKWIRTPGFGFKRKFVFKSNSSLNTHEEENPELPLKHYCVKIRECTCGRSAGQFSQIWKLYSAIFNSMIKKNNKRSLKSKFSTKKNSSVIDQPAIFF